MNIMKYFINNTKVTSVDKQYLNKHLLHEKRTVSPTVIILSFNCTKRLSKL